MSTPALLRLRERFPDAAITLLTHEKLADLWLDHPAINTVIPFSSQLGVRAVARRLRPERFNLALILPNSIRSALEVWLAGIPRRIGYRRAWRNWLLTERVGDRPGAVAMHKRSPSEINALINASSIGTSHSAPLAPHSHHIFQYLHLTAALGANPEPVAPQLHVGGLEPGAINASLLNKRPLADFVIGLNPGAEYGPAKRWPIESFAAVANDLYRRLGCEFLVFGGQSDVPLADQLCSLLTGPQTNGHVTSLAGKTTLRELMASLRLCHVLLTNDTGPMHVAAALGTPVVVPFGSTSAELTGPGLPGDPRHRFLKSNAPCSPCFLRECPIDFRCLKGITAERVTAAIVDLLKQARASGK
jgi:heptosyltransferase-2